ncbi:putative manganese transporter [Salinarimonas soli]|uniref:Uncharacterized protein n=1 Tax=Salinarimonas soli TaxID=1638099 RepID=A0A5B2VC25_9HYPH|nr:putative manganese transporter [Salinarimonas soli]KAA2236524.1 hypothetical protein F0L46_14440 [Salinarimonas soli]
MSEIALGAGRWFMGGALLRALRQEWMLVTLAVLAGLALASPELREKAAGALADAYLEVSTFVALTLAIFYGLERWAGIDLAQVLGRHRAWQVPIAAILGATPGCGAEILLVTQYTRGVVSFGAIVAALTATMGDSAFLLIAKDPPAAAIVIGLCTLAGIAAGYAVNLLHPDGLGVLKREIAANLGCGAPAGADERPSRARRLAEAGWLLVLIPGLAIAILEGILQLDVNAWFGAYAEHEPTKVLGLAGGLLAIAMFITRRDPAKGYGGIDPRVTMALPPVRRMIVDTNFVTFWVVLGLFGYEIVAHATGGGVGPWLQASEILLPLTATLIGLIPGCGVMVLVTTLYLQHGIPLAALISAAISTDGDALFPAIALAPRAAVLATLYTAVPALVAGYGWYFVMG